MELEKDTRTEFEKMENGNMPVGWQTVLTPLQKMNRNFVFLF